PKQIEKLADEIDKLAKAKGQAGILDRERSKLKADTPLFAATVIPGEKIRFASVKMVPAAGGIDVSVLVRATKSHGLPLNHALLDFQVSDVGIEVPQSSFGLNGLLSNDGHGFYSTNFFAPSPQIGYEI